MKKIILLLMLSSLSAFSQIGMRATNGTASNPTIIGGLMTSNSTLLVGDHFTIRGSAGTSPAKIDFWQSHNQPTPGHGLVEIGSGSGDVVINPTASEGAFQIGLSGIAGNRIHVQYLHYPTALLPLSMTHPFRFAIPNWNGGSPVTKLPGITGASGADTAAGEGQLLFWTKSPLFVQGDGNVAAPTIPGVLAMSIWTNGIYPGTNADGSLLSFGGNAALITNVQFAALSYDPDAQAYFTRASVTDAQEKLAISRFFVSLKAGNIYTNFDAIYFFPKTGSLGMNSVSSSFDITFSGSPVRDPVGGIIFDGVNDYGDTGYNPSSGTKKFVQNSASMVLFNSSAVQIADSSYMAGVTDGSRAAAFRRNGTSMNVSGFNNNDLAGPAPVTADYSGWLIGTRTASTVMTAYIRANITASSSTVTVGVPTQNIYIGARNAGGPFNYSAWNAKLFMIGSGLSTANVISLTNAIAALRADMSLVLADQSFAMTNFIEGFFYTNNTGKSQMYKADIWKVPVAVSGYVGVDIRVGNGATMTRVTGQSDPTFLAATLLGPSTNSISAVLTNGGVLCFTNISSGALNTAGLVTGTGNITTY